MYKPACPASSLNARTLCFINNPAIQPPRYVRKRLPAASIESLCR
ncbi:hypothetical protein l13_09820 [Neisseria weaveri ATCC 51223]|nr:hypothetical protein l13_09820 [Neisseria weaveri ATCC 51223]